MRSGLLITAFIFLFAGCGSGDKVPRRYLQPEEMKVVVWDLMRADQFLADFVLNKDSSLDKLSESTKLYQQVLAIHKLSKDKFEESFSYYRERPSLMKALMDSVGKMPATIPVTISAEPQLAPDSLRQGIQTDSDRIKSREKLRPVN